MRGFVLIELKLIQEKHGYEDFWFIENKTNKPTNITLRFYLNGGDLQKKQKNFNHCLETENDIKNLLVL